jgi:hypothetical protein
MDFRLFERILGRSRVSQINSHIEFLHLIKEQEYPLQRARRS